MTYYSVLYDHIEMPPITVGHHALVTSKGCMCAVADDSSRAAVLLLTRWWQRVYISSLLMPWARMSIAEADGAAEPGGGVMDDEAGGAGVKGSCSG